MLLLHIYIYICKNFYTYQVDNISKDPYAVRYTRLVSAGQYIGAFYLNPAIRSRVTHLYDEYQDNAINVTRLLPRSNTRALR